MKQIDEISWDSVEEMLEMLNDMQSHPEEYPSRALIGVLFGLGAGVALAEKDGYTDLVDRIFDAATALRDIMLERMEAHDDLIRAGMSAAGLES